MWGLLLSSKNKPTLKGGGRPLGPNPTYYRTHAHTPTILFSMPKISGPMCTGCYWTRKSLLIRLEYKLKWGTETINHFAEENKYKLTNIPCPCWRRRTNNSPDSSLHTSFLFFLPPHLKPVHQRIGGERTLLGALSLQRHPSL